MLAPLLMMGAGLGCLIGQWMPGGDPRLWALVCLELWAQTYVDRPRGDLAAPLPAAPEGA
mgnify:CR=1 FL=1